MHTSKARSILIILCTLCFQSPAIAQQPFAKSSAWQVYFSPRGGATEAIVQTLDDAKSTVLVQAYSFTSRPIAEALVRAHERGVNVTVILDNSQRTQRYSVVHSLVQAGIPTFIDASHAIAHNKVMIIDGAIVVTGSFNFSKAAEERNAENLVIIHDKQVTSQFADNWRFHLHHSLPFRRR